MPYIAGHPFSQKRNEFLLGRAGATAPGILGLQRGTVDPGFGAADGDFLYNLSGNLTWEAAGVTTILGAVGGVGTTWESLYANDTAWALTGAFTITQSTANTITINKTNVGAGAVLTIANSGSGNDITGPSWSVISTGAVGILELTSGGTINATGGALTIGAAGTATSLAGSLTVAQGVTVTATGLTVTAGGLTVSDGGLTVSNTQILLSDGIIDGVDNSNILSSLRVTNNTVTTFGLGGASTGVVLFRSTSLTTGSLLSLQLTEGTLVGGFYLRCFDVTAGADVLTIGENGAIVITGAGAENDLTLTAGDILGSDTSLTLVDADNAASLSITNNTATTATVFTFLGSGVFTGSGATSFVTVIPSGLTTGTAMAITAAALTTGSGLVITPNAITTGIALLLTSSGTLVTTGAMLSIVADGATTCGSAAGGGVARISVDGLTTGTGFDVSSTSVGLAAGQLADFDHTASGAIVAKTAQLVNITASRTNTAAAAISDDYDAFSIIRSNIVNDAGGTLNAAGSCLRLENISTQTAGTLEDTVIGLEVTMTGGAEAQGAGIAITHSGTTVGRALFVSASQTTRDGVVQFTCNAVTTGNAIVLDANGLTTGIGLELTHTTSVITTGSVCRITSTGIDTGTAQGTLLDLVSSAATAATVVSLVADALTTGIGILMSFDGLTTGEGVSITHTTSVIADGGSLFRLSSTGIDTGGATNGTVLDLSSTAQLAGVVALFTTSALTTGTAVRVVANSVTTGVLLDLETSDAGMAGSYIRCFDGAAVDFSVGEDGRVVVAGAAAIAAIAVTAGDISTADGAVASAIEAITLGAAATTIAADSNYIRLTGDAGGNSVTTITGGVNGQVLYIEFQDALVTIVNDNTAAGNTIDLVGANTTFADDAVLTLIFNGTSWYEVTRSVNA